MTVKPIPDGYHTVTPWMIVNGAAELIDFLQAAFGAEEIARVPNPDGKLGHAEVRIGDSVVMMFDAGDDWPPTPCFLRLYVENGDDVYQQALRAGGTPVTQMTTLAFGDRVGRIRDPFGNIYWIQTRLEALTPDEMYQRMQDATYAEAMKYVEDSLHDEMRRRVDRSS